VATLRPDRRPASPALEPLCAALLGLAAGLSIGAHLQPLYALLALLAGG
jgi:hypothetical protein